MDNYSNYILFLQTYRNPFVVNCLVLSFNCPKIGTWLRHFPESPNKTPCPYLSKTVCPISDGIDIPISRNKHKSIKYLQEKYFSALKLWGTGPERDLLKVIETILAPHSSLIPSK